MNLSGSRLDARTIKFGHDRVELGESFFAVLRELGGFDGAAPDADF